MGGGGPKNATVAKQRQITIRLREGKRPGCQKVSAEKEKPVRQAKESVKRHPRNANKGRCGGKLIYEKRSSTWPSLNRGRKKY